MAIFPSWAPRSLDQTHITMTRKPKAAPGIGLLMAILLAFSVHASAQNEVFYPYNPDTDGDGIIATVDLLHLLTIFSMQFTPEGIVVDGMELVDWILYQDGLHSSPVEFLDTLTAIGYLPQPQTYPTYQLIGSLAIGHENNDASGYMAAAVGRNNVASGNYSFASGKNNVASGNFAHAEGNGSTASGTYAAHAEGEITTASGMYSHSEGRATTAAYSYCHAEGVGTYAFGNAGHAEGGWTESRAAYGHTQNYRTSTYQYAPATSAAGYHTHADQPHQFVVGRSNVLDLEGSLFVVGNGGLEDDEQNVAAADRSDAFRVFENGNAWVSDTLMASAVQVGGSDLASMFSDLTDQIQTLQATIDSLMVTTTPMDACNNETSISYHGIDYAIVAHEDQCWFAENLQTDKYRDGSEIAHIEADAEWSNTTDGAWCAYDNDDSWVPLVGRLYNGFAIEDPRALCPTGWRVTTNLDWFKFCSEMGYITYGTQAFVYAAHGMLVDSLDATPWHGSNAYGLNIRPSGARTHDGEFGVGPTTENDGLNKQVWYGLGKSLFDLSLDQFGWNSDGAHFPILQIGSNQDVYNTSGEHYRQYGLAVRCIKE